MAPSVVDLPLVAVVSDLRTSLSCMGDQPRDAEREKVSNGIVTHRTRIAASNDVPGATHSSFDGAGPGRRPAHGRSDRRRRAGWTEGQLMAALDRSPRCLCP
jgi:hypothetical protein